MRPARNDQAATKATSRPTLRRPVPFHGALAPLLPLPLRGVRALGSFERIAQVTAPMDLSFQARAFYNLRFLLAWGFCCDVGPVRRNVRPAEPPRPPLAYGDYRKCDDIYDLFGALSGTGIPPGSPTDRRGGMGTLHLRGGRRRKTQRFTRTRTRFCDDETTKQEAKKTATEYVPNGKKGNYEDKNGGRKGDKNGRKGGKRGDQTNERKSNTWKESRWNKRNWKTNGWTAQNNATQEKTDQTAQVAETPADATKTKKANK